MSLLIQKFGGTSLATMERIEGVAQRIIKDHQQGNKIVVVVSAMAGETDRLINQAKAIYPQGNSREFAVLVSTGEQVTAAMLALALLAKGFSARSYTARQLDIVTEAHYKKARILEIATEKLREDLEANRIPIVAGFQGRNKEGENTLLGRGGSDTTAVALAAALNADECQIFTDVEGIYTTDPHLVPSAKRLNKVNTLEIAEMANLGAKVLHPRSVHLAAKYEIPLRVLSSFKEGQGTLITSHPKGLESAVITGLTFTYQALITLYDLKDSNSLIIQILRRLGEEHIEIDLFTQQSILNTPKEISFTVVRDDYPQVLEILKELIKPNEVAEKAIVINEKIVKLALVGLGLRSNPEIITTLFEILGGEAITIYLVSSAEIKISLIVDEKHLQKSLQAIHQAFHLDQ